MRIQTHTDLNIFLLLSSFKITDEIISKIN